MSYSTNIVDTPFFTTLPAYANVLYGFRCENDAQTADPNGMPLATCPDVKVRYKCLVGLTEIKGRIYTEVHGRADAPDFFANRLMEYPKPKFKMVCVTPV